MIRFDCEALCCNDCGFNYLHQYKVEVFDRQEDEKTGTHSITTSGGVHVDHNMEGNPSSRRDGIRVFFNCEGCDKKQVLSIVQHKGMTYIEWEKK